VVVPAFRPGDALVELCHKLCEFGARLVVVDDGSGQSYRHLFDQLEQLPGIRILRHAVNLGKGMALRTGINHLLVTHQDCDGLVTADADGQHHPEDILAVANYLKDHPGNLVLGARTFDDATPLRSRLGNQVTCQLFRLLHGIALTDTQTGLRGIPRDLATKLLRLETRGYDFELDMLILARYSRIPIGQIPIRTIYLDGNLSSHFNPVLDSMRIYFLLLRFSAASAITAVIDNAVFFVVYGVREETLTAQVVARSVALIVNFQLNRRMVFHADSAGGSLWFKYVAVVIASGSLSYAVLSLLVSAFGWNVVPAKLTAEAILFLFNFAFLRDFVFTQTSSSPKATDWSRYYQSVPATAHLTRKYTTRTILNCLAGKSLPSANLRILEFGGANSCFVNAIVEEFHPGEYHIADTNQFGLDLLKDRKFAGCELHLHNADIFKTPLGQNFDLVYSVGLIEHFDANGTAEAIKSHFRHARPGGLVLITFPRPTFLYRIARSALELFGLWRFPDERPLQPREVLQSIQGRGTVLFQKTLWPLVLTQHLILVRTNPS
jgi:putative flippase GtrA